MIELADRTCLFCGADISDKVVCAKYCCPKCKMKHEHQKKKEHAKNNLGLSKQKICLVCGKEYKAHDLYSKYCSRVCQALRTKQLSEQKRKRICQVCGQEFIAPHPGGKALKGECGYGLYCSNECSGKAGRTKVNGYSIGDSCSVYFGECKVCGKWFGGRKRSTPALCCSTVCASKLYGAKKKEYKKIICKECGKEFKNVYGVKNSVFCSRMCFIKNHKRNSDGGKPRKRAKRYGVKYQYVDVNKVFERDGWKCQICGKRTPKAMRGKNKHNSPELDHRIPMSNGGDHTYNNVQCACRACNGKKSNTSNIGQLPLFDIISRGPVVDYGSVATG